MSTKLNPKKLHLIEVRILEGHINSPFEFKVGDISSYKSDFALNLNYNEDLKMILCNFDIQVYTISEPVKEVEASGKFGFSFIYKVENFEELITVDNKGTATFEYGLKNALASITYSTSRGILLTRFQGTVLSSFILP